MKKVLGKKFKLEHLPLNKDGSFTIDKDLDKEPYKKIASLLSKKNITKKK